MNFTDPLEVYSRFQNNPLAGVYHIKTGEVTLYPCVEERIQLDRDDAKGTHKLQALDLPGLFTAKVLRSQNPKISKRSEKELLENFAPRYIICSSEDNPFDELSITPHQYLLMRMNELSYDKNLDPVIDQQPNYRGFTVTAVNGQPTYSWVSGCLNSPRKPDGRLIKRISGALLTNSSMKKAIIEKIELLSNEANRISKSEQATEKNTETILLTEEGGKDEETPSTPTKRKQTNQRTQLREKEEGVKRQKTDFSPPRFSSASSSSNTDTSNYLNENISISDLLARYQNRATKQIADNPKNRENSIEPEDKRKTESTEDVV